MIPLVLCIEKLRHLWSGDAAGEPAVRNLKFDLPDSQLMMPRAIRFTPTRNRMQPLPARVLIGKIRGGPAIYGRGRIRRLLR